MVVNTLSPTNFCFNELKACALYIRKKYNFIISFEDLMDCATLGYMKASNNYDVKYKSKFCTYLFCVIKNDIIYFISKNKHRNELVKVIYSNEPQYIAATYNYGLREIDFLDYMEHNSYIKSIKRFTRRNVAQILTEYNNV